VVVLEAGDTNAMARLMALNNKAEQDAIHEYTETLSALDAVKENYKGAERVLVQGIINSIKEIISDELNHAQKLTNYYKLLTGITPAKD